MSVRRVVGVGAAVAVLFAAGAVVAPATSAEPVLRAAPITAAPPFAVRAADGLVVMPESSRSALMKLVPEDASPVAALDVLRADLAMRLGLHLPDMHPATSLRSAGGSEAGGEATASAVLVGYSSVGAGPAGDLNADGIDDVIVMRVGDGAESRAVDGRTGAVLWTQTGQAYTDIASVPMADVSGDGNPDLFSIEFEELASRSSGEPCPEDYEDTSPCDYQRTDTFRWTYGVVSGRDGSVVWQDRVDGSRTRREWQQHSADTLHARYEAGGTRESDNEWVFLDLAGDHDRDGANDVIVNTYGERWSWTHGDETTAVVLRDRHSSRGELYSTEAVVRSGADGDAVLAKSSMDAPEAAWLAAAPQLVGDPTPDLLWVSVNTYPSNYETNCRSVGVASWSLALECPSADEGAGLHRTEALDGRTLTPAWSHAVEGYYGWSYPIPDLDGDGVADVASIALMPYMSHFVSGASGTTLWSIPDSVMLKGEDLTGTGRPDVVTTSVTWPEIGWDDEPVSEEAVEVVIERRVGATGELYGTETVEMDTGVDGAHFGSLWIDQVQAGGSPAVDLLVSYVNGRWESPDGEYATHEVVVEGRGGVLSDVLYEDADRRIIPLADVDADGRTDVLVVDYDWEWVAEDEEWGPHWAGWGRELVSPIGGSAFWTVPEAGGVGMGGNHDDAPGVELLLSERVADGEGGHKTQISSVVGTTGERRWTVTG